MIATAEINRFISYSNEEISEDEGGKSYSMIPLYTPL